MRFADFLWEALAGLCLLILAVIVAVGLTGCLDLTSARPPEAAPAPQQHGGAGGSPAAAASLAYLGATCTWLGGIAMVGGIVVRVAALAFPLLAVLAPFAGIAAACGTVTLLCGVSLQWLAGNLWLMAVAIVAGMGVAAWLHWRHLRADMAQVGQRARAMMRAKA